MVKALTKVIFQCHDNLNYIQAVQSKVINKMTFNGELTKNNAKILANTATRSNLTMLKLSLLKN